MTIVLDSAPRGCGTIKKGAVYGGATAAPGGTLRRWTWLLGKLWGEDTSNSILRCTIPARNQVEINLPITFYFNSRWLWEWRPTVDQARRADDAYPKVPAFGLADHVGESFYTPIEFMEEAEGRGANRRIAKPLAKKWASRVPFPVLFSHRAIPTFRDQQHAERLLVWGYTTGILTMVDIRWTVEDAIGDEVSEDSETQGEMIARWSEKVHTEGEALDWSPTWQRDGFGLSTNDVSTSRHPAELVLRVLEEAKDIPEELEPIGYDEALFGASWFTAIYYVLDGPDDCVPSDLVQAGLEAGVIAERKEEI